jgi:hypothetical protein
MIATILVKLIRSLALMIVPVEALLLFGLVNTFPCK